MILKNKKMVIACIAALLAIVLVVTVISLLTPTKKKVAGIWEGSYEYGGASYTVRLILSEDGGWQKIMYKNGREADWDIGVYTIKGGEVRCWIDDTSRISYRYLFGKLKNGRHWFSKV